MFYFDLKLYLPEPQMFIIVNILSSEVCIDTNLFYAFKLCVKALVE